MSTDTRRRIEESSKLDDADEWTYGDPLAPEAHDPDRLLPELARHGRMRRLLARIERMARPRERRPPAAGS